MSVEWMSFGSHNRSKNRREINRFKKNLLWWQAMASLFNWMECAENKTMGNRTKKNKSNSILSYILHILPIFHAEIDDLVLRVFLFEYFFPIYSLLLCNVTKNKVFFSTKPLQQEQKRWWRRSRKRDKKNNCCNSIKFNLKLQAPFK